MNSSEANLHVYLITGTIDNTIRASYTAKQHNCTQMLPWLLLWPASTQVVASSAMHAVRHDSRMHLAYVNMHDLQE
jgi:hypothetical protein